MSRIFRRCLATMFGTACVLAAIAASVPATADPPGRVGRLSEVAGVVSFHAAGEDQWSPAVLNEPVTSGNSFWTEPQSRAELRIGSTAIHLDSATELDIDTLDDHQFAARLPQGTINVHIFHFQGGDGYTIATPRGTVTLNTVGTYHIEAGSDVIPTRVATLQGAARIVDNQASLTLTHGEAAVISGTDRVSFAIEEAQPTPFDDDSLARDRREAQLRPAARYVSPEMTGYEDLDDYGTWQPSPEYGPVWYPQQVPVDWAPYREGHWRWIEPWGWTWVDDEPWGFAPFHYGRWAFIGGRWGWVPGTVVVRPVYAPALVAFVGGAGWSLSLAVGQEPAIGWFPLAPREVYVPSYPTSINYVRNVNVTNVTNVTNINVTNVNVTKVNYVNRQFATVVPQKAFAASHPVKAAALDVPHNAIAAAPVAPGAPLTPAVAAETRHPEAVKRAKAVAEAQAAAPAPAVAAPRPATPSGPRTPAPPAAPGANPTAPASKPAAPVAPGPPIIPNAKAGEKQPAIAGQANPAAPVAAASPAAKPTPSVASAPPAVPGPRTNHAAQVPEPAQAKPPTAAAPGPPVNHAATSAPEAAPPKPPTAAAPGPPINHAATPSPQAPTHAVQAPEPPQAKLPAAVIPSLPSNRAAPPIPAPAPPASQAQRHAPAPVAATPVPPANHGANQPVNRPPEPVQRAAPQNQAPSAPPPQVARGATAAIARAPNPPPPERNVPRPVQQTQLQPTQQGWVRTPPPPQQPQPKAQQQGKPAPSQQKGNPQGQQEQKHD